MWETRACDVAVCGMQEIRWGRNVEKEEAEVETGVGGTLA